MSKQLAVWIEDLGDRVSVETGTESANMKFIQFRDGFEEVTRVRAQPCVVPG